VNNVAHNYNKASLEKPRFRFGTDV